MNIFGVHVSATTALTIFVATGLAIYLYGTNETFRDWIGDGTDVNKIGPGR